MSTQKRTLHITNGDSAAHGLRRSSAVHRGASVLPWRDVLHDGPVVDHDGPAAFRARRAAFLASRSPNSEGQILQDFTERDTQLEAHVRAAGDIVLWFEPDVYDQLQLVQVLTHCATYAPRDLASVLPTLTIAPADGLLGTLEPEHFAPLFAARRPVLLEDINKAKQAWRAITASTPEALMRMARNESGTLATRVSSASYATTADGQLPHLSAALHRLLEEYPSASTGVSRTEQQLLQALLNGPMTLGALFPATHHANEQWPWLGDTSFAWYVERLCDVPKPLVVFSNGSPVRTMVPDAVAPDAIAPETVSLDAAFWTRTVMLTEFGLAVAEARGTDNDTPESTVDVITANGIDRWIGGVHLSTANHWRYTGAELVHMA